MLPEIGHKNSAFLTTPVHHFLGLIRFFMTKKARAYYEIKISGADFKTAHHRLEL